MQNKLSKNHTKSYNTVYQNAVLKILGSSWTYLLLPRNSDHDDTVTFRGKFLNVPLGGFRFPEKLFDHRCTMDSGLVKKKNRGSSSQIQFSKDKFRSAFSFLKWLASLLSFYFSAGRSGKTAEMWTLRKDKPGIGKFSFPSVILFFSFRRFESDNDTLQTKNCQKFSDKREEV